MNENLQQYNDLIAKAEQQLKELHVTYLRAQHRLMWQFTPELMQICVDTHNLYLQSMMTLIRMQMQRDLLFLEHGRREADAQRISLNGQSFRLAVHAKAARVN